MSPKRKKAGEQFIEWLQGRLGEQVDVPRAVTDVPRVTRFPGLDAKERPVEQDYSGFNIGDAFGGQNLQEMPELQPPPPSSGSGERSGFLDDDEDIL